MSKEINLKKEVLNSCSLLNNFLNYDASDRPKKIVQLLGNVFDEIKKERGETWLDATIFATSAFIISLRIGPQSEDLHSLYHSNVGFAVLLVAIGYELGKVSFDSDPDFIFAQAVTNKAIEEGLLTLEGSAIDYEQQERLAYLIVKATLISGVVGANPADGDFQLDTFQDYINKLN